MTNTNIDKPEDKSSHDGTNSPKKEILNHPDGQNQPSQGGSQNAIQKQDLGQRDDQETTIKAPIDSRTATSPEPCPERVEKAVMATEKTGLDNTEKADPEPLLAAALKYIKRGWFPVPIKPGCKKPWNPDRPDGQEWEQLIITAETAPKYFPPGWGIGLILGGPQTGELTDIDIDCNEGVTVGCRFLPATGMIHGRQSKPRSHWWYLCHGAVFELFAFDGKGILEIRSSLSKENEQKGHQTVVPPSIRYPQQPGEMPEPTYWETPEITPANVEYQTLRRAVTQMCIAILLARYWPQENRHYAAMAAAGLFLRHGLDEDTTFTILDAAREVTPDPDWKARRDLRAIVRDTAHKLEAGAKVTGGPDLARRLRNGKDVVAQICEWLGVEPEEDELTDLGNARRLVAAHGEDIRYTPDRGWYVWDERRWVLDRTHQVNRWAHELGDAIRQMLPRASKAIVMAQTFEEKDQAKKRLNAIHAWAKHTESVQGIEAAIKIASSLEGIVALQDGWDRQSDLITCRNGTIHLPTSELRQHSREDMATKMVDIDYDPSAKCPRFDTFIMEILSLPAPSGGIRRPVLEEFLHILIGYTLTGRTSDRGIFILYGPKGHNGKTLLMTVLDDLMGDYSKQASMNTFVARRSEASNDLAGLASARLVTNSETDEGARLSESIIKAITGGSKISVRYLYSEYFDFRAHFKLWIDTNHRPEIRSGGPPMWKRIRLIPFEREFVGQDDDKGLAIRLSMELPGIFARAVAEAKKFYDAGMTIATPPEVIAAVEEYHEIMDQLADFLREKCREGAQYSDSSKNLWKAYVSWVEENHVPQPLGRRGFANRIGERFQRRSDGTARLYQGVEVNPDEKGLDKY